MVSIIRNAALLLFAGVLPTLAATRFVNLSNSTPSAPFTSWSTAATNIQDAIDEANDGDLVLVTNGMYATGGKYIGYMTNRIAVTKAITVRSVNGPSVTTIKGGQVFGYGYAYGYGYGYGYDFVNFGTRCAWLGTNAVLSGFTLTEGHTMGVGSGSFVTDGGGVWCSPDWNATVSNCVIKNNFALGQGGGVSGANIYESLIESNSANDSGGGAWVSKVERTIVRYNSAPIRGGGLLDSSARDCLIAYNTSDGVGGGLAYTEAERCTIVFNIADFGAGGFFSPCSQCIVVSNVSESLRDFFGPEYSCTIPPFVAPFGSGVGNINTDPVFLSPAQDDFRLQGDSPCIDTAGPDVTPSSDPDGIPRPLDGNSDGTNRHDMGAFEFVHPLADSDGDHMGDADELAAGTEPINSNSLLVIEKESIMFGANGVVIHWQSVPGRLYDLARAGALTQNVFLAISSNLAADATSMSYTDHTAVGAGPFFYRVAVQR